MTERSSNPTSDAELAERARAGDNDAFAELWRRHAQAGRAIARSVSPTLDPDDLVAEAYGNIYALVKRGRGPTGAFRPYLAAAIRNIATSIGRSKREAAIDFADELMDETTSDDAHMRKLDRDLTTEAFRALPERWQQALWYSEVEDMSVKECAQLFGITPPAMAMLTFRAREGLRDAWIQAHIASVDPGTEHEWTVERLGAHARERLTKREALRLELHLKECESCANIAQEARTVAARLASCLLPPLIGAGAAAAYLKEIGAGTTTASAISSGSTAGAYGFSSTNALHASLHQLHVIVGSSAAISLGIASGVTLAELPAERPAEQVAGHLGSRGSCQPDSANVREAGSRSRPRWPEHVLPDPVRNRSSRLDRQNHPARQSHHRHPGRQRRALENRATRHHGGRNSDRRECRRRNGGRDLHTRDSAERAHAHRRILRRCTYPDGQRHRGSRILADLVIRDRRRCRSPLP